MRFAGITMQYSKNAIPQLMRMTAIGEKVLNLRCQYHAIVISMLENTSNRIGKHRVIMYYLPN